MTSAERTRRYRERQRTGVRSVTVPVSVSATEILIHHRLLPNGTEHTQEQIASALVSFIRKAGTL